MIYFKNYVGKTLRIIGIVTIILGVLSSIIVAIRFKTFLPIIYGSVAGFVAGMLFIGFAEVIFLLDQNNRALMRIEKSIGSKDTDEKQ